jgi:hypothetical protein
MFAGTIIWNHFLILDVSKQVGDWALLELECKSCGNEFTIDTETEYNMVMSGEKWVPKCPECGQQGIA